MQALKLKDYMEMKGHSLSSMARSIGRSRQIVTEWVNNGAYVEITRTGLKITISRIVHESQVKK